MNPSEDNVQPQVNPPLVEGTLQQVGLPPSVKAKIHKDQPDIPGYEFIKRLGKGGMGVVWLCKDVRAGRLVALKQTITDELSESDRQRFRTEAQAMAKLQHPNIVQVFEVDEHEGRPFFTMDYCPGGSLHEYLDRKPQPAKICAEIVEKLALGVQHAHENGIIHRDLKPANVLLGGGGSVAGGSKDSNSSSDLRSVAVSPATSHQPPTTLKLTDFGLAKNTEASQQFTRTESVMGTPSYMSPEQGKETKTAGAPADVWSLGVILYECITGSLPFVGADLIEVLDNIRHKEPVPPSEKVKCPRDLETICLKCLRKDSRDRYASAQKLAEDLRAFLEERSISARPMGTLEKSAKWVRRNPSWAAMLLLFAVTLGSGTVVSLHFAGRATKAAKEEAIRAEELGVALKGVEKEQEKTKKALKEVEAEREKTQQALDRANDNLRDASILRIRNAEAMWEGDGASVECNALLDAIPEPFRGWEWHFLKRKYQGWFAAFHWHGNFVTCLNFSPDGGRIVSGSEDNSIRVWDARSGVGLLELKGHTGIVWDVCFSPDGNRIASSSEDGTVRIWDAKSGTSLMELVGHADRVRCVCFSPDGNRIVSGSYDSTLRIWDAPTGTSLMVLPGHTGIVKSVDFSPDGRYLVSGSGTLDRPGEIRIWNAKSGANLFEMSDHTASLTSVRYSPDGSRIVSGAEDNTVRIWDAKTGAPLNELKGHTGYVQSVCFSPDGSQIASGSWDKTIRIWDAKTGEKLLVLKGDVDGINSISYSSNSSSIAVGAGKSISIWNAKTGANQFGLTGHSGLCRLSNDNSRIAFLNGYLDIQINDAMSAQPLLIVNGGSKLVTCLDFAPDGKRFAAGSLDNTIRIWETKTGRSLLQFRHPDQVRCLNFSPDGAKIVSGSEDGSVHLWDASSGQSLIPISGHTTAVTGIHFSSNGNQIASESSLGTVCIWDANTGMRLLELNDRTNGKGSIAFSPDRTRIATASRDHSISIWEAKTGQVLVTLKGHTGDVSHIAFSPDGGRIASGSFDGSFRIWNSKSGECLLELQIHTHFVRSLSFTSDGQRLLAGRENAISIWHTRPLAKSGEKVSSEELTFRRAMLRLDYHWHYERRKEFTEANNTFAASMQNYLLHKAIAEEHIDYNRFDQAFYWSVAAQILKPKPPVIDWPEVLAKPKELN